MFPTDLASSRRPRERSSLEACTITNSTQSHQKLPNQPAMMQHLCQLLEGDGPVFGSFNTETLLTRIGVTELKMREILYLYDMKTFDSKSRREYLVDKVAT